MAVTIDGGAGSIDATGDIDLKDNDKVKLGASDDIQIYHDGTNSYIKNDTGHVHLSGNGTNKVYIQGKWGEESIIATGDGSVEVYHNNSKKLETTATGIKVQGGILFGSDTAAENTLSDYEEGTFTPNFTTWNGSSTIPTINSSYGYYIKTGKFVKVWWFIVFASAQQGNTQWGTLAKPIAAHTASSFIDGLFAGGTTENGGFHYIESGAGVNYLSGTVDSGSTTSWAGGFSYKTG